MPVSAIKIAATANHGDASWSAGFGQIKIGTSAPLGDFFNVKDGLVYDPTESPIQRAYLAKIHVNSDGTVGDIKNYPVARLAVLSLDVNGLMTTKENVKIVDFGVVKIGERYAMPNPFGNENYKGCTTEVEILIDGVWGHTGWSTHTSISYAYGVDAHAAAVGIVVRTAATLLVNRANGHSFPVLTTEPSYAPCRAIVTFHGDATNA